MKCVIFDLDGTLLYTLDDLYYATNFTLEQFGYKKILYTKIDRQGLYIAIALL